MENRTKGSAKLTERLKCVRGGVVTTQGCEKSPTAFLPGSSPPQALHFFFFFPHWQACSFFFFFKYTHVIHRAPIIPLSHPPTQLLIAHIARSAFLLSPLTYSGPSTLSSSSCSLAVLKLLQCPRLCRTLALTRPLRCCAPAGSSGAVCAKHF